MADHDNLLAEFQSVTGADASRAKFFLEAADWELHVALGSFFDNDGDDSAEIIDEPESPPQPESQSQVRTRSQQQPQQQQSRTSSRPRRSNVTTFGSLKDDESDSSDDEGQAFFAGGSEHSGQQILGPGKKKANPQKLTQALFEAAKQHGAEVVDQDQERRSGQRKKPQTFGGSGQRLGSENEVATSSTASATPMQQSDEVKMITYNLKFWSNGFSVNDGPLRSFDDPDNREFLGAIEKGEIPGELAQNTRGAEVHVNMEDHRTEEYVKPKLTVQAFSGQGQMLGNPTPQVLTDSQQQQQTTGQVSTSSSTPPTFSVDPSQPVTTIQIRLTDGTRLVSKFNHGSTVADIFNLVRSARPNTGGFVLMTTFPTKELTDTSQTLADAGLLNSTIVQRLK